jgi:DnaJ family protein A protein 2
MGGMITQQITTCSSCHGQGKYIKAGDRCKKCVGDKVAKEDKKLVVHIERGMEDGDRITFQGASDEYPDADCGDVIVIIREKKHDDFIRKHDDLLYKKKINLSQALLGCQFSFKHLDNRIIVCETQKNKSLTPGAVKVIEREGMPIRGNPYSRGKLYIAFEVVFPTYDKITPELKTALVKAIPIPDELKGINLEDENVFKCSIADANLRQFENAKRSYQQKRSEAYSRNNDEDEEGVHFTSSSNCQPM